jgi:hypothetical protein
MSKLWNAICKIILAVIIELREAMRDDGKASWSRYGSLLVVVVWCIVVLKTKAIPERTEMVAILVGALYGVNKLPAIMDAIRQVKPIINSDKPDIQIRG